MKLSIEQKRQIQQIKLRNANRLYRRQQNEALGLANNAWLRRKESPNAMTDVQYLLNLLEPCLGEDL